MVDDPSEVYTASAYHQSSQLCIILHACIGHEFRKIVSANPQLWNYLYVEKEAKNVKSEFQA